MLYLVVPLHMAASILLLVRPDRASLAEAADVLVWMHDQQLVARSLIVVPVQPHQHQSQ